MALSTVACAVIISTWPRSPSGVEFDVLANQLEAAELRHHVVDDEQVERALGEQPLRLARARRVHDAVAGVAQGAAERLEDLLLVVDEQNRAANVRHRGCVCGGLYGRSTRISVPAPGVLSIADRAAEAFDDVLRDRQAESRPAALGREVRIEDVREVRRIDAAAVVGDDHA